MDRKPVTLLDDFAHLALGHLGQNKELCIPQRTNLSLGLRGEVEAEFVAYVVANRVFNHTALAKTLFRLSPCYRVSGIRVTNRLLRLGVPFV